jgi:tetratricopeptide (TPR) repeat protein
VHDDDFDDDIPSHFSPDPEQAAILAEYMAKARRWVPVDFDIDAFWYEVLGDLDLSMNGKLNLIHEMIEGEIPFEEVLELRAELVAGVERWDGLLGEDAADAVRDVMRRYTLNPRDVSAMTSLPPGDPDEDAAVQLFAFVRVAGNKEVTAAERLDMLRSAAAARPSLPGVQRTLAKMFTILAVESPDPEEHKALLRDALQWITRAQRQCPEDPRLREDVAYTLEELLQVVDVEPEATALLSRLTEHYAAALRLAEEPDAAANCAVRSLHGLALTNWRLAMRTEEPDESRRLLEEALAQVRQAIAQGADDAELNYHSSAGGIALELGWLAGDAAERRRAFESALESFAAMAPEEEADARHHEAVALVGLALLAEGAERAELVARAAGLFAAAIASDPEDGMFDRSEAQAWLRLAAADGGDGGDGSDGTAGAAGGDGAAGPETAERTAERRVAAERAVAAARRGLAREPEDGEGRYDLACALSLAGDLEDAARELAAVLERDPGMTAHALADADLVPLFAARPELRGELEKRGA